MCACQSATSISGARNSGLSGNASGGTGYARRHPSLVGARCLRQKMGAENCRDRRQTRRTRFSRRKAFSRWPKHFTTCPCVISPAFSNDDHEALLLTQLAKPSDKKGKSCPLHLPIPAFTSKKSQAVSTPSPAWRPRSPHLSDEPNADPSIATKNRRS